MKHCSIRTRARIGGSLLFFCIFLLPVAVSADAYVSSTSLSSLDQIEKLIGNGPDVLAAVSATSRDEELEVLGRKSTGAKYFGGITYGHNNEPKFDTSEDTNKYNQLSVTGGLNFPLLGTLQKEKIGMIETETAVLESQHHSSMLLLNNLVAIRKAYITLWIEQQKEKIAKLYLNTEGETVHVLQEREAQGLVLPGDRLDRLSVYYDVKRDIAASKLRQMRALNLISLATGQKWDVTEKLKAPSLPNTDGKKIDFDAHPEVLFQNNLVAQYEKLFAAKKRIDREANLTIGLTGARDFPGATGNGAYVTFSMTEPVKESGSKDQAKLAASDDLNRAKKNETFIRMKLAGQMEEALATAAYAADDVKACESNLIVTAESIREKMLRRMVLPGDTFEELQKSKSQYYRTALEMLDHEELFLQSAIDIISYVYPSGLGAESKERVFLINENDVMRNKLLAPNWLDSKNMQDDINAPLDFSNLVNFKIPAVTFGSIEKMSANPIAKRSAMFMRKIKAAVYVWKVEPFLQSDTRTTALNEIVNAGFTRVLMSFNPKQISNFLSSKGEEELGDLLAAAKDKGLRIDLMLGDSAWAKAAQRGKLIFLIKQLEKFDFDGIHLDIEPDSLPGASTKQAELLANLAQTLKAVKETTKLPVSISIHPRYLEGDLGVVARQKLLPLGLEEVVVMIYSDNPHVTAQRMSAIITSNPNVTFSLAQSVEKDVPSTQSYADRSRQEFQDTMQMLADNLAVYGMKGIFIQAWEDYKKGETL
jgi:hypothetical protein